MTAFSLQKDHQTKDDLMKHLKYFFFVFLCSYSVYAGRIAVPQVKFFPITPGKYNGIVIKDPCEHTNTKFKCVEYVKNYDGDTITVNIPNVHPIIGDEISVRVLGIDTAEIRTTDDCEKEMAIVAKLYVEQLIVNAKKIHLHNVVRDKYFRIGADVFIDGVLLSQKLLEENLAYAYEGDTKPEVDWCQPLDEQF